MEAEVLALKWNNHQSIFYQIICGLRTKGSYTDVTLACDSKFYPVHKLVLSTCSDYFAEIFDRTPCKNPVVVLKDIQCKDLEFLLDYMYVGEVNVKQTELPSLLKAAECLKVKGLAVQEEPPKNVLSSVKHSEPIKRTLYSPPAKRRRCESDRESLDSYQESNNFNNNQVEDRVNADTGNPSRSTESSLSHHEIDQEPKEETDIDAAIPVTEIKIEQDVVYEDGENYDSKSAPSSYNGDQNILQGEQVGEGSESGVNFNDLLQTTMTDEDSVNPNSSIHDQINIAQSWEEDTVDRTLPSQDILPAVGDPQPAHPHQRKAAAAAAIGMIHTAIEESQPLLMQHIDDDKFNQQQHMAEGGLDYMSKKDKAQQREYGCEFCGRQFGHRTNLQAHLRIHTGEKPFRCLYCTYRTALKGNLKMHCISRHKVDWKSIQHLVHAAAGEQNAD